jgi:FtsZ-binding cell division protein ZapB
MQKELSFMQMELYEVKENINMQQEMYETEVKNHQETKLELFDLEEKFREVSNDCQIFQRENKDLIIENSELKRIV